MFTLTESLILLLTCLFVFYKYLTKNNDYFVKKNIPHVKPSLFFGNFAGAFVGIESIQDVMKRLHIRFKDEKIYGMFNFGGPVIVLRDIELIKQITVKDSDYFVNRRELLTEEDDLMFGNAIFAMRDAKWKDMRSTLTPAFTGTKMRIMFDLIRECCEAAIKYLRNELESNPNGIEIDSKDFFNRLTNDIIASCAFGIKVNSLEDRDNEFYKMGKKVSITFNFITIIKFFLKVHFRKLSRAIGLNLFDTKHVGYFKNLVLDSMKYRQEHNIVRPDMINMLMEARNAKDRKRDWTDNEIVAQCFSFFMAGFETTSYAMCFATLELMINSDMQEKLISEIDKVRKQLNGTPITYDILLGMKYLDMVVSETFRKWPGAPFVDRTCSKNYELNIDDVQKIPLKINDDCLINIYGSHVDPENFPDPEKFDPERFSDENKANIKPYTYLPFGSGPRNCIGNRFALMEIKAILYYLLSEFKFEVSKKISLPIKLKKRGFLITPKAGFWLKVCSRK